MTSESVAIRATSRPRRRGRGWFSDRMWHGLLAAFGTVVFSVVALIVYETARGAAPSLRAFSWNFLTTTAWDPVAEKFGALPYVYGTLVSSGLALLLALPCGIGAAVYLAEIAPRRVGEVVTFMVELLASVPSIVYGMWGVFSLAPWLRVTIEPWLIGHLGFLPLFSGFPFGLGMLNAGVVLAIMILPTIVSLSREMLLAAPTALREAALALGATRAETLGVTLEWSRPGIIGAVILALGRALGETMAVTMVIGNTNHISASLLAPGATLASVIANEFSEATSRLHLASLIEIALVLFVITLLVNAIARLIIYWSTGGRRGAATAH